MAQIRQQLKLAVDRVMTEGSVYDPELAALAIKQAAGDLVEAIFLLRAYRATLPRLGTTCALDTSRMVLDRRISATFKDLPGGQVLGPTYDYTQRLLDFKLLAEGTGDAICRCGSRGATQPHAARGGPAQPGRLDRNPPRAPGRPGAHGPHPRAAALSRQPGHASAKPGTRRRGLPARHGLFHPARLFALAIRLWARCAWARWRWRSNPKSWALPSTIGDIEITECEMVNQFAGSKNQPPQFTRGYGLAFGHSERKAMAMSLVDRALRADELGEAVESPAQMQEFVLSHSDSLEASGFVQHLKLPHYVDFQSELELVRKMRARLLHHPHHHRPGGRRMNAPMEPAADGPARRRRTGETASSTSPTWTSAPSA